MADELLHVGAVALCPHGGTVQFIPASTRVMLSQQPAVTAADVTLVAGCAFLVLLKPQPCVLVQWLQPATRVKASGRPVLLRTSSGLCTSPEQIGQGPPQIAFSQSRVKGT